MGVAANRVQTEYKRLISKGQILPPFAPAAPVLQASLTAKKYPNNDTLWHQLEGGIMRRGLVLSLQMYKLGVVNSWEGVNVQQTVEGPKNFKIIAISCLHCVYIR